jgi:predicted phosphodiesterase
MEHKVNIISKLVIVTIFTISACSKEPLLIQEESANQRFIQSMEWNNSHQYREIVVPGDDYSVLSMADSHVGSTRNLDNFFNIAKTTNASAVVMVGDLTSGHTEDYKVFGEHLPDKDLIPEFIIAGNHDLYFDGWKEFISRFGSSSYIFTVRTPVATDLFICLETGGGTLGDKQLEWLTGMLETSRKDCRKCFVFTHNNIFRVRHTTSTNPMVEELHVLLGLFTKYHVDFVVTGHDHEKDARLFGITTYIQLDALKDGISNSGYCNIKVKNGSIGYTFESI